MLTPDQAQQLAASGSVVSVFESRMNALHTTHSWEFLEIDSIRQYKHLPMDWKSDVIVGVIDTGVWPESESFNDKGLGPMPEKFKGECVPGENFTLANCNRKIIGARFYSKGWEAENGPLESSKATFFRSARDSEGHGSHTASTIAGSMTACNVAPWILTVTASSVDREFNANIHLGNSKLLKGFSLNHLAMETHYSLIAGSSAAAPGIPATNGNFCKNNTLDPTLIKGKIVVCTLEKISDDRREKGIFIGQGGGVGMILIDPLVKDVGFQFVIPATLIGQEEAQELQAYMTMENSGASLVQLKNLTGEGIYCRNPTTPTYNFNYPSIGISKMNGSLSVYRTVTYYGKGPTVYVAHVNCPSGVDVKVIPDKLDFTETGEKKTFRVDFKAFNKSDGNFVFGDLTWSNGILRVRSPIALNVLSL
ncbi:hypothetical protein Q3G72_024861 [Acer saccharum]|nr:hypothetical protein Q3G72_024861 [Acer saccharum]